jgi:hypothetical protein
MDLEGTISNRSAIGAIIKLKTEISGNYVWQMRRVAGQNGYCGQTLEVHFGLGDAQTADSIIIIWPSGIEQVIVNQPANQKIKIVEDSTLTSVKEINKVEEFGLLQNYPNPFNPITRIDYTLREGSSIKISVYNQIGELIQNIFVGYKDAGLHSEIFNANELSTGVYFCVLTANNYIQSRKMLLLK